MKIGLAVTTNKTKTVFASNLPNMVGKEIDTCLVVNHCSEYNKLSKSEIDLVESLSSTTNVKVHNFTGKFHEARNETFNLLDTDVKVKWDDDLVFSSRAGSQLFKDRIEYVYEKFGEGHFFFTTPTFAIHPRLLTKAKPFTGMSGDACICIGDSDVVFSEDKLYADRQKYKAPIKAFIGSCGVLHLDQLKEFKYLVYRSLLNTKMRHFNLDNKSMEESWESRLGQPIQDSVKRLVKKMNTNASDYFYLAPNSIVEQLPKEIKDLAHLSVKDFRREFFGEDLDFDFDIEDLELFDPGQVDSNWLFKDFE